MVSKSEYIGFEEPGQEEEEQPKKKSKITFEELTKDMRRAGRWGRPRLIAILHFIIAFGGGSVVNYLVAEGYIKPAHVTQITFFILLFTYLRLNYRIGEN